MGVQYNRNKKLHFNLRGKKEYPVTANELLTFNIKARCAADEEFREVSSFAHPTHDDTVFYNYLYDAVVEFNFQIQTDKFQWSS